MKEKANSVALPGRKLTSKQEYEPTSIDDYFLEKLRRAKTDYRIRKAGKSNDIHRRRIAKLVLDCFLRYHGLQQFMDVNSFQVWALTIELGVYQRLKKINLICKEQTDEETRLETVFKNKVEGKKWALKLTSEGLKDEENAEDIAPCGALLDKIIGILKGERDERRAKSEKEGSPPFTTGDYARWRHWRSYWTVVGRPC